MPVSHPVSRYFNAQGDFYHFVDLVPQSQFWALKARTFSKLFPKNGHSTKPAKISFDHTERVFAVSDPSPSDKNRPKLTHSDRNCINSASWHRHHCHIFVTLYFLYSSVQKSAIWSSWHQSAKARNARRDLFHPPNEPPPPQSSITLLR